MDNLGCVCEWSFNLSLPRWVDILAACVSACAAGLVIIRVACALWVFCKVEGGFSFLFMEDINLVDPASSHTLVSKIKPCMSKYKHFCTVKLRMAHYISYSLLDSTLLLGYP